MTQHGLEVVKLCCRRNGCFGEFSCCAQVDRIELVEQGFELLILSLHLSISDIDAINFTTTTKRRMSDIMHACIIV